MKLASMHLSGMPMASRPNKRRAQSVDRQQPAIGLALAVLSSIVSVALLIGLAHWIA